MTTTAGSNTEVTQSFTNFLDSSGTNYACGPKTYTFVQPSTFLRKRQTGKLWMQEVRNDLTGKYPNPEKVYVLDTSLAQKTCLLQNC